MKKKIKVWIASDKEGTFIWKNKPEFDKFSGLFCMVAEENYPFKIDNSKHLYKEPTEVYISIEEKHINKPKRASKVKNMFNIKNIIE